MSERESGSSRQRRQEADGALLRVLSAAYGAALRLQPAAVRQRCGEPMRRTYMTVCRRALRQGGRRRLLRTALGEIGDQIRSALRARAGLDRVSRRAGATPQLRYLRDWGADTRFAWRTLVSHPGFTVVAVLTLAIGIAASTAIFSVVDSVVLRTMPFPDPERLVTLLRFTDPGRSSLWSIETLRQWRDKDVFESVEVFDLENLDIAGEGVPVQVQIGRVSPGMFRMLGVQPSVGRDFLDSEGRAGSDPAAVLSYGLAVRRFGSPQEALGATLSIAGIDHRVVGIMPRGFHFPYQRTQAWTAWSIAPDGLAVGWMRALARMKPGASLQATQERADQLAALAGRDSGLATVLDPGMHLDTRTREEMRVLFAAVAVLVLIACANTANLLLARLTHREREIAIRAALGAGRGRLVRQALIESLLLALMAGLIGTAGAWLLIGPITAMAPERITLFTANTVDVDVRALGFAFGLSLLTAMLFGLLPALRGSRPDVGHALGGARGSAGQRTQRLRNGLVVAEVGLSLVLLIAAGLLMGSFARLRAVDPGFDPTQLLAIDVSPSQHRYTTGAGQLELMSAVRERVMALPGVLSASIADGHPPSVGGIHFGLAPQVDGGPEPEPDPDLILPSLDVAPDYFATLGIEVLLGRGFTEQDTREGAAKVMIVNEAMAHRYFAGESPIGKRFRLHAEAPWREVVGVAADVKMLGPVEPFGPMEFYLPLVAGRPLYQLTLLIRVRGEPAPVMAAVRQVFRTVDPLQPAPRISTLTELLSEELSEPRFYLSLVGGFALIAAFLAAIGVYGVISYSVARRAPEIGIRMALGAESRDVMRLVLGNAMRLALVGVVLGTGAALTVNRYLDSLLFEIGGSDPTTFTAVGLLMLLVALAACWVPARRALRVDPIETLRAD